MIAALRKFFKDEEELQTYDKVNKKPQTPLGENWKRVTKQASRAVLQETVDTIINKVDDYVNKHKRLPAIVILGKKREDVIITKYASGPVDIVEIEIYVSPDNCDILIDNARTLEKKLAKVTGLHTSVRWRKNVLRVDKKDPSKQSYLSFMRVNFSY